MRMYCEDIAGLNHAISTKPSSPEMSRLLNTKAGSRLLVSKKT